MTDGATTTHKVVAEIRAEMARQGVSQVELAIASGLSLTVLRRRLAGDAPLTVDELVAITKALDVSTAALIARAEEVEPPAAVSGRGSRTRHPSGERNGQ